MSAGMDRLRGAGYPKLAAAIEEMVMTSTGVVPHHAQPQPPVAEFCDAPDPETGELCDLPPGHATAHQAVITITWPREDQP